MTKTNKIKIGITTLGCDKNTVDSEYLAGLFAQKGCDVFTADSTKKMDAVVINTCGFINDAKAESVNAIIEWSEFKKSSQPDLKVIVVGCLAQRYNKSLAKDIPEIDLLCGVGNWDETTNKIIEFLSGNTQTIKTNSVIIKPDMKITAPIPRQSLDKLPYGFLRIADGCNHQCSFCAIPQIKGPYRSFPRENIIEEAKYMLKKGVKELNIIAQDITNYGKENGAGYELPELLEEITALKGDFRVRLLYAYPSGLSEKLINLIAENDKICKYLDIPLQHLDPGILRKMYRPFNTENIFETIKNLRKRIPEIVIRTTFIVGFPGETEAQFQTLYDGIKKLRFERVGVFEYSDEEGTEAAESKRKVSKETKHIRFDTLLRTQSRITRRFQRKQIGKIMDVLVEQETNDPQIFYGRGQIDAPEVDGGVLITNETPLKIGEFVKVKIVDADIYDLFAELV